jgi:hypothetical protein
MNQPACRRSAKSRSEPRGAIGSHHFDAEGAEHVDTPVDSGLAILLILGHGIGNRIVNDPVAALLIVVVSSGADLSLSVMVRMAQV